MKHTQRIPAIAVLALAAVAAHAQSGADREQVKRDFEKARSNGELMAPGEAGLRERDLYPQRYPAPAAAVGKSREQVRAELATAQRSGELVANGEAGVTEAQLNPARYGMPTAVAGKSRAEVIAELNEARRNGDLFVGESGLTLRQTFPQRYDNAPVRRDAQSAAAAQPSLTAPTRTR